MSRFKVGDHVRTTAPEVEGVRPGVVVEVIANEHHLQIFDEYAVDFGETGVLIAYDNQLEAA